MTPGAPKAKLGSFPGPDSSLLETCLSHPTLWQSAVDFAPASNLNSVWRTPLAKAEAPARLPGSAFHPLYLSGLFRATHDSSSPYILKTRVAPALPLSQDLLYGDHDVEARRYPLLHELTGHLRRSQSLFKALKVKEEELIKEVLNFDKLVKGTGSLASATHVQDIENSRQLLTADLKAIREMLKDLEAPIEGLEKWALKGGKDKAVTREAGLDMVFRLYRANEAVTRGETGERMHSALDFLRETQGRRLGGGPEGTLGFGLAVVDFNITGPNTLDRDLGDLVLDETFRTLRKRFPKEKGSTVSLGTRTNFRIVNPDSSMLNQGSILQLEEEIESNIRKRVEAEGKPTWKKFVEDYRAGVSVGYAEVEFRPGEIQVGRGGEYTPESVAEQLGRLDHGFRLAHARSQEVTAKLKEQKSLQDLSKADRLHDGQKPVSDLNGIPEGRYVEPGDTSSAGHAPTRLVHSIQGMREDLKSVQGHLNSLELLLRDPVRHAAKVQDVLVGANQAQKTFTASAETYYSLAYDASHDLRMPRLVERSYAAERIDSVVRESGGAKMLFVEMGKFKGFITGWYGGGEDKYVHDLIYDFNKIVVKHGLVQIHPGNRAPLFDEAGNLAVDPKTGQYFKLNESTGNSSSSGLRLLRDPQLSVPVGSEVTLAIREGDEIGFIVGERKLDGQAVTKEEITEVFKEFSEVLQNKYGHMLFDDVEKVKPDNIRLPKWELHEWKEGKEKTGHIRTQSELLMTEADATAGYTGWVVDYESLKESDLRPSLNRIQLDSSEKTVARRERWRYYQEGAPTNKVFEGKIIEVGGVDAKLEPPAFPERLKLDAADLVHSPILARTQTRLSAGYVAIDIRSGAQLEKAWATVNEAAKFSKAQNGKPIFLAEPPTLGARPPGHRYDSTISLPRSREIAVYFDEYSRSADPEPAKAMSAELAEFVGKHGVEIVRRSETLSKESFAKQIRRSIQSGFKDVETRDKLLAEATEQLEKGGSLARVRDGLMASQVMQREGLSLDYRSLGPSLWTALDQAEKSLSDGKTHQMLGEAKARFVKLYIQQTGTPPPEAVLAEGRKFIDPRSIFIPEEIFSLARRYKVPPERVPFFVAGLKAEEIRKTGQQAFRELTYEDLRAIADSPEGQAFLKDPKNSLLLQDTLKSRSLIQGVPLLTSMLTIFPAELLCGYLAKKIGASQGLSSSTVEELKFGMTLYFLHGFNLTAAGAWEVAVHRGLAGQVFTGTKSLGALDGKIVGGILQPGKIAGQEIVEVGLKTGDSLRRAMWQGVLEKWGVLEGEKLVWKTAARHMLLGVPRVPINLLRTMGAGYLSSAIYDKAAGQIWTPDHPMRKYGSFVAFFAPDLLRLGLGSSRIAASPWLSRGATWFSRAGTGLMVVGLVNYGVRRLVVGEDYDAWVNQRVGDKVYGEHVEKLEKTDWFVLPLLVKGARWGMRKLAPDIVNLGVAGSNDDIKEQILAEDRDRSQKVFAAYESLFPRMLTDPNHYDLSNTQSYQQIDFNEFVQPVTLSAEEEAMLKKLDKAGEQPIEQVLPDLSLYQRNEFLRRVQISQLQQGARYLVQIGLPENAWAREIFAEDGTLKPGMGTKLLAKVHPSKEGEPDPTSKVLTSRQVMIGLALLGGKKEFLGRNTLEVARVAGVVDAKNKYVMSSAHYAALSLYGQQLRESADAAAAERLGELSAKLQAAYLKAEAVDRPKLMEALRCLGVSP
ncbi:MAG TPA: hypothetical protein VJR29_13110 [bacterium]|nr:hypothetical protein [bacterium]